MIPVAVSVPNSADIKVEMHTDKWAFGEIVGTPQE